MKANELRLTNLVFLDDAITEIGITQLMNFAFWEKNEQEYYPNRWKPIPLTPQMYEKCGFTRVDNHSIKDRYFWSGYNGFTLLYDLDSESAKYFPLDAVAEIKYVHELQNMYFALTKKELEINL
jgi:hypothetical protein